MGALNGQHITLAKRAGSCVWQHHAEENKPFLVLSGRLRLERRDRTIATITGGLALQQPLPKPPSAVL